MSDDDPDASVPDPKETQQDREAECHARLVRVLEAEEEEDAVAEMGTKEEEEDTDVVAECPPLILRAAETRTERLSRIQEADAMLLETQLKEVDRLRSELSRAEESLHEAARRLHERDAQADVDTLLPHVPTPLGAKCDYTSSKMSSNQIEERGETWIMERARYIPLRLTLVERKMLRLVQGALNVSEYVDKIDIISYHTNKAKRIVAQVKEVCAILSGLLVAANYREGQALIKDREFKHNEHFFQRLFEVARRHKIMCPEKMRSEYGSLVYMLQDTTIPEIEDMLQFKCVLPVQTAFDFLEKRGGLNVLRDPNVIVATHEIFADGKSRAEVQREIREKERAQEFLARKYSSSVLSNEDIKLCLYSISDNHAFLRMARDPCDRMIQYLTTFFDSDRPEDGYSLAIQAGYSGARLTHHHQRQFFYVLQSLTLWREVTHEFFKLWCLAEQDLLDERNVYRLRDTGQGLNRLQSAPRVGNAMRSILANVQQRVGSWVGSSVIHLGDHNVPNALMFIDKYIQVPRILGPIVNTLHQLDTVYQKPGIRSYIDGQFKGLTQLKKEILADFFRHAFDGSGADNFFDAGSCIDGRLTSAWNWCQRIEKKQFFPAFLLTGFIGFDGGF